MLANRIRDVGLANVSDTPSELGHASPIGSDRAPGIQLLEVVWRRQWVVWLSVAVFLACAFLYLSQATPIYEASAKLLIQRSGPRIIAETLPQQYSNPLSTQSQIMQSSELLKKVTESSAAKDLVTLAGSVNPIGVIKSALKVEPDTQGQILNVSYRSTRPTDAATIVNSVVDVFTATMSDQQKSNSAEMLKMIQAEKVKREAEYKDVTGKIIAFQRANGILSFQDNRADARGGGGGNIITTRLAELSDLHTQAEMAVLDARIALKTVEGLRAEPAKLKQWVETRVANLPSATAAKFDNSFYWTHYQQLTQSLQSLQVDFGPDHPKVVSARATLQLVRSQLDSLDRSATENYIEFLKTQMASLESREQQLGQALSTQRELALDLNSKAAELSQLQTDARRLERLLDLLDNRIKEVDVNSDTVTTTVTSLELAKPSTTPVEPKRSRVLGISLVLGLMFGVAFAAVLDRMDMRLRSIDEVAQALGLPVLGVISHMDRRLSITDRGQYAKLQPKSDIAESYRTLRTAIFFGVKSECRTILVTSPMPGDGKSTCASNVAITLAQTASRVLLIDADCRRPVQNKIFKLGDGPGISDVLEGGASLKDAIRHGVTERLDILPCGKLPDNPAELLNSMAFKDLMIELSGDYDKIIIDSPPLIPVTDARILSAACDVTLLVLRAEKSTRRAAEHAREAIMRVGGTILGAVVNDVPRNHGMSYGYYYGYKGDYTYGYSRREENGNGNGNGHSNGRKAIESQEANV